MKRLKMLFTAIAVVTVVGGALAFKSHKSDTTLCYDPTGVGTTCPSLHGFNQNGTSSFFVAPVPAGGCKSNTPCNHPERTDLTIE